MVDFLLGCDPEVFVRNREGNLVNAFGMIPGTKHEPYPVKNGFVQVDGMALEFNINPASSFAEWDNNITSVISQLENMIPVGYSLDFSPVANFGKEYIDAQPEESKELGCDPDFNAYTGDVNSKPDGSLGFRTASGHIHIGWTEGQDITVADHITACQMLSKQLDVSLGVPSMFWDLDRVRQKMYGLLGTYRPKHYGVEYRTMSNAWVKNPILREYVYRTAIHSAQDLIEGDPYYNSVAARQYEELSAFINSRPKGMWSYIKNILHSLGLEEDLGILYNYYKKEILVGGIEGNKGEIILDDFVQEQWQPFKVAGF